MPNSSHQPPAIIIVDDEQDVLAILQRLLRQFVSDHEILVASNATQALSQMDQRRVDLVITDYSMNGMNGLQLADEIKLRAPLTNVVMITAFGTPLLAQIATRERVDYVLNKPFSLDSLEHVVHTMIA